MSIRRLALNKWLLLVLIVAPVLALDQITKSLVVTRLNFGESVALIPGLYPFFRITYSRNTGSAFGLLPQAGDLFLLTAVVVVAVMVIFYPRVAQTARLTQTALALVCGGALGNALDRLQYGHVVDFIHYTIPGLISNVSNVADHAIVGGVILLLVDSWRQDRAAAPGSEPAPTAPEAGSETGERE